MDGCNGAGLYRGFRPAKTQNRVLYFSWALNRRRPSAVCAGLTKCSTGVIPLYARPFVRPALWLLIASFRVNRRPLGDNRTLWRQTHSPRQRHEIATGNACRSPRKANINPIGTAELGERGAGSNDSWSAALAYVPEVLQHRLGTEEVDCSAVGASAGDSDEAADAIVMQS